MSSLASFITENMEAILEEWQAFAGNVQSAKGMDRAALRNDAAKMLETIAQDMQTSQSEAEQEAKGKGARGELTDVDTAATSHGKQRFASGFDLDEMVSEYRALRASVIRLWVAKEQKADDALIYELTRFNEGIDQALCESVWRFSGDLDRSRELFMGVLGHDLRTPLHIILSSSEKLLRGHCDAEQQRTLATYVNDSAEHVTDMVTDLLDVVRTQLGRTLPVHREEVDASALCRDVVQQFQVLHPTREIRSDIRQDLHGLWDRMRLHQLLMNLMRNAFQHGDPASPVTLSASSDDQALFLTVHNLGQPIPQPLLTHIFEPLRRGEAHRNERDSFSMGLGLYIAHTIAVAHQGSLSVESTQEHGTSFTACLPLKFSHLRAPPARVEH